MQPVSRTRLFLAVLASCTFSHVAMGQTAGDVRADQHGAKQVFVSAGCFLMGADKAAIAKDAQDLGGPDWAVNAANRFEAPQHKTCLTQDYWIDQTEVTNAAFAEFVADGGYEKPEFWSSDGKNWLSSQYIAILPNACETSDQALHPRVCVTFFEAEAFANWRGGRLPTEAEWEFAARGPESLVFPWGNQWNDQAANVLGTSSTSEVGVYPAGASWVGALDMAGNAMEWVSDWLQEDYYASSPINDPQGPENGYVKAEKGGWWGSNVFVARSSYKHFEDPPTYQDHHIGFRVVSEVTQ